MKRVTLFLAGSALPAAIRAQDFDWEGVVVRGNVPGIAVGGGRLFFALAAGILLAIAFQWILTCLTAATGIAALGKARRRSLFPRAEPDRRIHAKTGIWAAATAALSAFCAAWLATEMIRFGSPGESVILGLSVWAGFLIAMLRLETAAPASLLGDLLAAFSAGLRSAAAPFKAATQVEAAATAEEVAAKVREEFRTRGGSASLKDRLKEYVGSLEPRALDRSRLESEAEYLFEDPTVREAVLQVGRVPLRGRFQEITAGRVDLSLEEQKSISEVLQDRWNRLAESGSVDAAWTAGPAYAGTEPAAQRAQSAESQLEEAPATAADESSEQASLAGERALRGEPGTRRSGASPYAGSSSVSGTGGGSSGASRPAGQGSASRTEVRGSMASRILAFKDFLRKAEKHDLNPGRIEQEVETMVYHPEEGFAGMERDMRDMRRDEMAQALRQRRDITLDEADSIADLIDAARTRILSRSEIREHRAQETADRALARIHDFVYSLRRPALDMEGFKSDFGKLIESEGTLESLRTQAAGLNKEELAEVLAARKGISREEAEALAEEAGLALKSSEESARRIEEETQRRLDRIREAVAGQAEAERKLAASAAWWLAGVSAATAIAAALGGLLGAAT